MASDAQDQRQSCISSPYMHGMHLTHNHFQALLIEGLTTSMGMCY